MKDLGFYVFLGMMVTFGAIALLCAKISDWCHTYIHTYIHTVISLILPTVTYSIFRRQVIVLTCLFCFLSPDVGFCNRKF